MMFFLYGIGLRMYVMLIRVAAIFNAKAKQALVGRRKSKSHMNLFPDAEFVWFHCASLGEFEQGRSLIEKLKSEKPEQKILLTFFSPSGYEIRKDYNCADVIVYLPFDTRSNVQSFLAKYKIKMLILVKYEIWPNLISELLRRQIPVFITSAVIRRNHWFFKWYGGFVKQLLAKVNAIFVQDDNSMQVLVENGIHNGVKCGDARIDRVLQIKNNAKSLEVVEHFLEGNPCIVFGSTYKSDLPVIQRVIDKFPSNYKFIIVPHEVDKANILKWKHYFPTCTLWSEGTLKGSSRILIVDTIGYLSSIYQYATLAYIGGGFEKSIHNILEPAVYHIPVYFGPKCTTFPEANSMVADSLCFTSAEPANLVSMMLESIHLKNDNNWVDQSNKWFNDHSGATKLIMNELNLFI